MPLAWVVLTVVSVACIDQASKAVLLSRLSLNGSVRLSRGVRLRHVVNVGVDPPRPIADGVASPVGCRGVEQSSRYSSLAQGGEAARAGVAVALGGATGNFVDRLLRGHIVDFIEIGPWPSLQRRRCGHRGRAGAHADGASHLMRPTLVTWGAFRIPSYVAMLYLGLLAGTYSAYAAGRADGMSGERLMGAILALLVPAVLGARLAFVASRWSVVSLAAATDLHAGQRRRRGRVRSPGHRSGVGPAPGGARASLCVVLGRRRFRLPGSDHLSAHRMLPERLLPRPRCGAHSDSAIGGGLGGSAPRRARYWPPTGCRSQARCSYRRSLPMRRVGS